MPEGKNHDIERRHSKRWLKIYICEIGNYFWDNPIIIDAEDKLILIFTIFTSILRFHVSEA